MENLALDVDVTRVTMGHAGHAHGPMMGESMGGPQMIWRILYHIHGCL